MTHARDQSPENGSSREEIANVATLAATSERFGLIWSSISDELNLNLLLFADGDGVEEHVNSEVDVLVACVLGSGTITIGDAERSLTAGDAVIVPRGSLRRLQSGSSRFAYLTCHRRRGGPRPSVPATTTT